MHARASLRRLKGILASAHLQPSGKGGSQMNQENQNSNAPRPGETDSSDVKDTVGWVINVLLKVGAGYLAKVILDALGF